MNIKNCNVAGTFYPAERQELFDMIDEFYAKTENSSGYYSRAIIVPHAGYIFSGGLAVNGYRYLNPESETVFVFAPSHYVRLFGCVSCDYDEFETPIGNCAVNKDYAKEFEINNFAFEKEHSIEVQLPLIKYFFKDAKIVPVLYGCTDYKVITEILEKYRDSKNISFVISTDLSHFYPERDCNKIDRYSAELIESGNIKNFEAEQACGAVGVCGLVNFANNNRFSLIRVGLTNSAAKTGDSSRVVGYGSWFLYEGEKNSYIKKYFTDFVIDTCKKSIMSGFRIGDLNSKEYPCVFEQSGASFVTLEINGHLRGCIGSIIAHKPLIDDLILNAHSSAFKDPRFLPLTQQEFEHTDISVSLLSSPEKIDFDGEEDLLSKIKPFEDGIIIRDGNYQAVYLPVVWEQLSDKREFLNSLKVKAGLSVDYFSDTLQAFRFNAVKIEASD